jgi:hypothetical protein
MIKVFLLLNAIVQVYIILSRCRRQGCEDFQYFVQYIEIKAPYLKSLQLKKYNKYNLALHLVAMDTDPPKLYRSDRIRLHTNLLATFTRSSKSFELCAYLRR